MRTKYIVLDDCFPVIFGDYFAHREMALGCAFQGKPTSAGFLFVNEDGTATAYGRSESLNLDSIPSRDSALLTSALNLPGANP